MSIDGCRHSFAHLAKHVLPSYMGELKRQIDNPVRMAVFATKGDGSATIMNRLGLRNDPTGSYVFIDRTKPIYVGISRRLVQRLMQHVRGTDHFSATLAYRIAATHHPHRLRAAEAMKDQVFRKHFEDAKEYLRGLNVAFIEITNPLELYLFEAYCAMELDTGIEAGGWNTFETH